MPPKAPPPPPEDNGEDPNATPEPVEPLTEEEVALRKQKFEEIFVDCTADDAKMASLKEKEGNSNYTDSKPLTYSELDFSSLHEVLEIIKRDHKPLYDKKGVFLDLGSGAGKVCIAAGLLHSFEKVVGIEKINCLAEFATAALTKYREIQIDNVEKVEIELLNGDFLTDGTLDELAEKVTICLAVATCFEEEELKRIEALAAKMPGESIFIMLGQRLPESIIIEENKEPAKRRLLALKKGLAVRGVHPNSVEIEVPPPDNDPKGWHEVLCKELELEWGKSTCFMFKKVPIPAEEEEEQPVDVENQQ